jgi:hypothetical protein
MDTLNRTNMKPSKQNQLAYAVAASEDKARRIAWKAYSLLCYHQPKGMDDVKALLLKSIELQTQK